MRRTADDRIVHAREEAGMATQGTGISAGNALKRPIEVAVEKESSAQASDVYHLLADPSSHLIWAGERQGSSTRLLTIDGPRGPIGVGDEFSSTGADPMGRFVDRSVVTEATPPHAFEFVTEATLTTKRGRSSVWTNVHRYEIEPAVRGCRVTYSLRVTRISDLPGLLRIFNWPVLSLMGVRAASGLAGKGVANLARLAEERAAA